MTDATPDERWTPPAPPTSAPPPAPTGWGAAPEPSAWASAPPPPPPPPGQGTSWHAPTPESSPQAPRPAAGAAPSATAPITFRSWQPGIVALRPLPFGDFITVPFKAMRFNRGAIVGGPLLLFSLAAILTAGAVWLAFTDEQLQLTSMYSSFEGIESITVVGFVIAVLAWIVADLFASTVVIPAVSRAALGERISLADALRLLASRFWALLLFGLILTAGGAILYALALVPILATSSSSGSSDAAAGGMLAIIFLVVVPVLFIAAPYIPVARAAIIMEKVGPIAGIKRAFTLMPGRFWWTILILFVVGLINSVIQQVFSFGTQMVTFAAAALSPDLNAGFIIALAISVLLQVLVTVVVQYSFVGSTMALIYLDLRMRKEGLAFELARAAEARFATGSTAA